MKKQESYEELSAKLTALNDYMQTIWTLLNTIAARLGMMINEKGEYTMPSDGVDVPIFECKSSGGTATTPIQQPAIDVETFANAVWEKFKKDPLPVKLGNQSIHIDIKSLVEGNKWLRETVTWPWNDWYKKYFNAFAKLHGYTVIEVGDEIVLKVDDNPTIPPNPYRDDSPSEPTDKSEVMPSSLRGLLAAFFMRLWQDAVSCFWKTFAYVITSLVIFFSVYLWWEQKQQVEQLSTEIQIYRLLFNCYDDGPKVLEGVDYNLEHFDHDEIYNYYKQRVDERQNKNYFERILQEQTQKKQQQSKKK